MHSAYRNLMQDTKQTLDRCFEKAFIEVVDNQLNSLPLPAGTITHLIYAPARMKLDNDAFYFRGYQQTSAILQKMYRTPEASLDSLSIALSKRLRKNDVEARVVIRKFDANTGETLALTAAALPTGFRALTSKQAFLFEEKGIAVEAILDIPLLWKLREVLLLFAGTLLLLACIVFVFIVRLRSVFSLRQAIAEQRQDFYQLAEQMKLPVAGILSGIKHQLWREIETESNCLLSKTEQTLSKAKAEEQRPVRRRTTSFFVISWISVAGVFLLLFVWAGYSYQQKWKEVKHKADVAFEEAFYSEVSIRFKTFLYANKLKGTPRDDISGMTRYAEKQAEALGKFMWDNKVHLQWTPLVASPKQMDIDDGFRLWNAYGLQDKMNEGKIPVPFHIQRMDSLFTSQLQKMGMAGGSIRMFRYPSREVMLYTVEPFPGKLNLRTRMLKLKKDGSVCIEGVVHSTPRYILSSIGYMLFPLGVTFLFVCVCILFQIRLLRTQRRLKQFQKDFSYSMIHDMKSPLHSVMMGAHILAGGKLADKPEKMQRYMQAMTDECEHLLTLSNRVVMLTQIDRGELELKKEEVALCPLFRDVAEKFQIRASKPVHFELDCEEGATVYADVFCLREVLFNLVDNAVKYSGQEVTIVLSARQTEEGTLIKVRDNGIGIPLREQNKIFGKFERVASGSRKTGAAGFGLGLNYVLQVVRAHCGTVKVESVEGSYSEFLLQFPARAGLTGEL